MRLIDQLERIQKGSQSFDEIRSICQRYLNKSNENQLNIFKEKLFDEKCRSLEDLFQFSSNPSDSTSFSIQFQSDSIEHFKDLLKFNFGQLNKSSVEKINCSSIPSDDQVREMIFISINDEKIVLCFSREDSISLRIFV